MPVAGGLSTRWQEAQDHGVVCPHLVLDEGLIRHGLVVEAAVLRSSVVDPAHARVYAVFGQPREVHLDPPQRLRVVDLGDHRRSRMPPPRH